MIPLIATTLLLATSALSLGNHGGARKSLSFGPKHPTAKLNVPSEQVHAASFGLEKRAHCGHDYDPKELAASFVQSLHGGGEFRIREDSYTDARTGVSHIYVRQIVNGAEVMDGDINVNIRDGQVISYGDSFYRGDTPTYAMDPSSLFEPTHDQAHHCEALSSHLTSFLATPSGQVPFNPDHPTEEDAELLAMLHSHNCPSSPLDDGEPELLVDPSVSALNFMMLAAPDAEVSAALKANYGAHLELLTVIPTESLISTSPAVEIHNVPHTTGSVKAQLAYVQTPHPEEENMTVLNLVWHLTVPMEDNAYEAFMSATRANRLISVVDWVSDAYVPIPKPGKEKNPVYNVWAWGVNDPSEGNRSLVSGYDKTASPAGWHAMPSSASPYSADKKPKVPEDDEDPIMNFTTTWGNNVFAHENLDGRNEWEFNQRPDAGSEMIFDYNYLPAKNFTGTNPREYLNLSITQLFYTANMIHDIYYRYGFDEKSGNFQQFNFGKGGKGNDAVICNAQDGSGYNNANFMTPPDGQNGKMRMYVWNTAKPWRDGDLEAGIVIHEYSHGLSTRLTGGPANSGCLGWGEAGGMGEGWGDFYATTIRSTSTYQDYAMGSWAANRPQGIRNFIYSLNMTVNPSTYKTLDEPGYWGVHAIGEVWAQILWIVENRLIKVHGFNDNLFPPEALPNGTIPEGDFYRPATYTKKGKRLPLIPKHGNTLAFQLVMDGMKLQPCRPSFFDARDAIIQADEILTGGENKCELWKGFSERGLGPDAMLKGGTPWGGGVRTDDYTLPEGICDVDDTPENGPEE
ncbi:hypothetical protein DACRYDRAFT_24721 [Dacryopinax primogenitus]|uniref:Extracellular metalloproteinase n=1 Tax=Dacryopinax primogenitus (strain DJM 731) TaxID=1858805 RepID=M5FRG5_DACPD|nr:uncharacterized protein DACRYDRAFT_24721 [Dacryopinax primogenitus]EJT98263.1 hypothetical protein DACRYDRAFT_24721 [Dacryopinax primogenitus]